MTLQIEYVSSFIISNKTIIRSNNESDVSQLKSVSSTVIWHYKVDNYRLSDYKIDHVIVIAWVGVSGAWVVRRRNESVFYLQRLLLLIFRVDQH